MCSVWNYCIWNHYSTAKHGIPSEEIQGFHPHFTDDHDDKSGLSDFRPRSDLLAGRLGRGVGSLGSRVCDKHLNSRFPTSENFWVRPLADYHGTRCYVINYNYNYLGFWVIERSSVHFVFMVLAAKEFFFFFWSSSIINPVCRLFKSCESSNVHAETEFSLAGVPCSGGV